jgi:predicted nucleotidyltransferase
MKKINNLGNFCKKHGVELAVVFGSRATGREKADSDVDLAVVLGPDAAGMDKLEMLLDLDGIFERRVDLIVLTPETDPLLKHEIFSNGKPLYEGCEGLFMRHKAAAWHEWIDTAPIRELEKKRLERILNRVDGHVA